MAGYDQVGIKMPGGAYNIISREEFEQKPPHIRIKMILDGQVQFVRNGVVITPVEALRKDGDSGQPGLQRR